MTARLAVFGAMLLSIVAAQGAGADRRYSVAGITTIQPTPVTLAGYFTLNDTLTAVVDYDIAVRASDSFAGFEYTTANSTVGAATLPSQYFRIGTAGMTRQLQFYFVNGVDPVGGTLLTTNSYEAEPSGGTRMLSGTVTTATAVPEAATWGMMVVGMGMIGHAARRRRKVAAATA